jgi:hypothetical protein
MIKSWFTQPPGGYASYYQYDTVTCQLSRIRLELGRTSGSGDTAVIYRPRRAVGFSKFNYSVSKKPGEVWSWSVNDDGRICYMGIPLNGPPPKPGEYVYDTSDPLSSVHAGNRVTSTPRLPPGIRPEHLALLANHAFITLGDNKEDIQLTGGDATPGALAAKIKVEVCRIVDEPDFTRITDQMILDKLTSQVDSIWSEAASEPMSSLKEALDTAKGAGIAIGQQIDEDLCTPTPPLEKAASLLESTLDSVKDTSSDTEKPPTEIGDEISEAAQAVLTAVKVTDTATSKAVAGQLDIAEKSLAEADQHLTELQVVAEAYEPLTKATSVQDYMYRMSGDESGYEADDESDDEV